MIKSRRIALSSFLIALGVVLSIFPGPIPIGPTRVFPFQHMINVISGIIFGPISAGVIAFTIGIIRISIGTGTIFAIPGGVPGALLVGFFYHYIKKKYGFALTEPIGTAIGALISALLVVPMIGGPSMPPFMGITTQWQLFVIYFSMSSIPGSILGLLIMMILRRTGVVSRL
ncbi:MAG: energy coupling factor transporter S component ThiW [Candidatus Methanomethyliaceae archaeon]|nr:energy coupling factor transporter S component ThiW [Candidatus Methanomethyliaceae archaeon]MDW7971542.1 energy coupling factor transporter S component ThiW [Nitrososphaerota archaeon]